MNRIFCKTISLTDNYTRFIANFRVLSNLLSMDNGQISCRLKFTKKVTEIFCVVYFKLLILIFKLILLILNIILKVEECILFLR